MRMLLQALLFNQFNMILDHATWVIILCIKELNGQYK